MFWKFYGGLMAMLLVLGVITGLWAETFILVAGFGIGLPICHFLGFID